MVGGMPAVVAADAQGADAKACRDLQREKPRMDIATTQGQAVRFSLLNLPHYLCAFMDGIVGYGPGR